MIDMDLFGELPFILNDKITLRKVRHHTQASEAYVDVIFQYESQPMFEISIPVNYRRTGVDAQSKEDCIDIIEKTYEALYIKNIEEWKKVTLLFWDSGNKVITRSFFDILFKKIGEWVCQGCGLPENPNWSRRIQDIKEFGFTLATYRNRNCTNCKSNKSHIMLLPIKQGGLRGYETISPKLKKKIIKVLKSYDAYESKTVPPTSILPDHKFPEIRWDEATKSTDLSTLTDDEIKIKFQLISNQRNEQKREVCRKCYQTSKRGYPYGIKYYYLGEEDWNIQYPKISKDAEKGCVGCGWYDLEKWRIELLQIIFNLD